MALPVKYDVLKNIQKVINNSKFRPVKKKKEKKKTSDELKIEKLIKDFTSLKEGSEKFNNKSKKKLNYSDFDYIIEKFNQNLVRDPEKWKSNSYNKQKQFIDFLKYCFCLYKVPQFFFNNIEENITNIIKNTNKYHITEMYNSMKLELKLFFESGSGKSIFKNNKTIFTKKEVHFFNTSKCKTFQMAYWKSIFDARNISNKIFIKCFPKIINRFRYNDQASLEKARFMYESMLNFISLNNNELTDSGELDEILDFCFSDYVERRPNYFNGRTVNSIIELSNNWHREMYMAKKEKSKDKKFWEKCELKDWEFIDETETVWSIVQLNTSSALYSEGNAMKHCVGSYVDKCLRGNTFIFSLRKNGERNVTLEVSKYGKTYSIIQAKAKANTQPTNTAKKVINNWKSRWNTL